MIPWTDWLGYAAAALTTSAFVPQVWLTFRTRDVSGISLGMYSVFTLGVGLWLAYGVAQNAWPLVIANSVTFVLAAAILVMKILLGRPAPPAQGGHPESRAPKPRKHTGVR